MTIQDIKYLKQNSIESSIKMFFELNNLSTQKKNINLITNIFTIHILYMFNNPPSTNFILSVYANDNKMDSVAINQQQNYNIIGREYEKKIINPLAKVSELIFKLTDCYDNVIDTDIGIGNVCILIRNYEPQTEFNDNYNELNPQYSPQIELEDSYDEDSEEEY